MNKDRLATIITWITVFAITDGAMYLLFGSTHGNTWKGVTYGIVSGLIALTATNGTKDTKLSASPPSSPPWHSSSVGQPAPPATPPSPARPSPS